MLKNIQEEEMRSQCVYSASVTSKNSGGGGVKRKSQQSTLIHTGGQTEIRQRVLSARLLRFKTMQNQLTMAQQQIHVS